MILDTFTFFNELDILNFRMKLLWEKVDVFVIVEANITHSGRPKPYNFRENIDRFRWAAAKILYYPMTIDVSDLDLTVPKPKSYDPKHFAWAIENRQREGILTACSRYDDEDLLILSDVDETPSYAAIDSAQQYRSGLPSVCEQYSISPSITRFNPTPWYGSIFTSLGQVRATGAQSLRNQRNTLPRIPRGGWHLSYHGGAEKVQEKLKSFAHQEFNLPRITDVGTIRKHLADGSDILGTTARNRRVDKDFYPEYFVQHVPKAWWEV